ncbi:MAG: hypothetical protein GX376_02410, partial [Firmicutes bacterium]|nr:hypothetical protein [Bacillota bacterium]
MGLAEGNQGVLLRDLVEVPPVRTVIRMADLDSEELSRELVESFVLTKEAEGNLVNILTGIAQGRGQGYFLQGNFGSGKSHLLGIMDLLLTSPAARDAFLRRSRRFNPDPALLQALTAIGGQRYLVVTLSLVEHSNREYLEDILLERLSTVIEGASGHSLQWDTSPGALEELGALLRARYPEEVAAFCRRKKLETGELFKPGRQFLLEELLDELGRPYRMGFNRREAFSRIREFLASGGMDGLVILVDELSEFLRSKPDSRTFNEDIRFLQYLGELAPDLPAWVVASLQERLEETGEVPPEAFNKIKDRYPVRLRLTGQHVAQLIPGRLISKKPGAEGEIGAIHSRLSQAFGELPFSRQEFFDLYPVHPLTVSLLDTLRPLFSQHRGVVDFIHYQLKGDAKRRIAGRLDLPADTLLGPDVIYDHFQNRLRELPETSPYVQQVYRYWEEEGFSLLGTEDREIARRLLKILILVALSPQPRVTIRRLTEYLLTPITTFDSKVNYEYIHDLLARMRKHGAYLAWEKGDDFLKDRVFIDLEADLNRLCRRRLDYIKKSFFPGDRRVLTKLAPWVQEPYLPLASWQENPRGKRTVNWQKTRREGMFLFGSLTDISAPYIRELVEELQTTELDFVFLVGTPLDRKAQLEHLAKTILPAVEEAQGRGFLFWIPTAPADDKTLIEALALQLLAEECQERDDPNSRRLVQHVQGLIADLSPRVREIYREAYFQGQILLDTEEGLEPGAMGIVPWERLLEWAAGTVLNRRYPQHGRLAPRISFLPPGTDQKTLEDFLLPGQIEGRNLDPGVKMVLDGFLLPLGLVRRGGKGYRLHLQPKESPVLAEFLRCLEEGEAPLDTIYRHLRKGPFGLGRDSFQMLGLTLLASGLVQGRRRERAVGIKQLTAAGFWQLETLARGGMLAPDFQEHIQRLTFLPLRLRRGPITLALQQELWEGVVQWRREQDLVLEKVRRQLQSVRDYPALAGLNFPGIEEELSRVAEILAEVKVSYPAREGLERFLSAHRAQPYFDRYYQTLQRLREFLAQELEHYLFMASYLTNPDLEFPPGEKYRYLQEEKERLLALCRDGASILNRDDYRRLDGGFTAFVETYREIYLAEHEALCAPERFDTYRRFNEGRSYKVLSLLAGIEAISVQDDLIKVDRQLQSILGHACREIQPHLLAQQPLCRCGFRLGSQPELIPREQLEETVEAGIKQYVQALQKGKNAQRLRAWLTGMEEVGKRQQVAPVRGLLALDIGASDFFADLEGLLNRRVIGLLNQALAGRRVVVERQVEDLVDSLIDRSFTADQITAIVQEWLRGGEDLPAEVYVKVVGRRGGQDPQGGGGLALYSPGSIKVEEGPRNPSGLVIKEGPAEILPDVLEGLLSGPTSLYRRLRAQLEAGHRVELDLWDSLDPPGRELVQKLIFLEDSLARLQGRKSMPHQWQPWEELYVQELANLEWWLARVEELALKLGVDDGLSLESLAT